MLFECIKITYYQFMMIWDIKQNHPIVE